MEPWAALTGLETRPIWKGVGKAVALATRPTTSPEKTIRFRNSCRYWDILDTFLPEVCTIAIRIEAGCNGSHFCRFAGDGWRQKPSMCLGKLLSILIRLVFQCAGNQFGLKKNEFWIFLVNLNCEFPILECFVFDQSPMNIRIYPILNLRGLFWKSDLLGNWKKRGNMELWGLKP